MNKRYKILITGPFSSGKTTFIKTMADTSFVTTEERISDPLITEKSTTTVGIDFGKVVISDDLSIYLFGTPGQERFDFIWEDQINGSIAIMLLVDRANMDSIIAAKDQLKFYTSRTNVPIVVIANKSDLPNIIDIHKLKKYFGSVLDCSIVECIGNDKESAREALYTVFFDVVSHQEKTE
ncbi:MAG: ATP/GTP-binding protein [Caldisericia bacterium]|nr:ATP/GTP-binding protein [Caldisericia bacterium]